MQPQAQPSFDSFGAQPQAQPSFDSFGAQPQPSFDANISQPEVPVTSPIQEFETPQNELDQNTNNSDLFSFGSNANDFSQHSQQPVSATEPIIVTDYTKQYDPIMPQSFEAPQKKVDFKEVINAIRECSAKIEQYGYKVDVEEYDLNNMYQVVFKIDK